MNSKLPALPAPPKTSADRVHELPLSEQIRWWTAQAGVNAPLARVLEACAVLAEKVEALEGNDDGPKCGAV